ncbi:MAG: zf-HC2 domain-containing protein [Candidatus Aminicenantes bacterium]|nr:zf-HC2 domain-containing protein [Candidatus Aminicenantes bacterium]
MRCKKAEKFLFWSFDNRLGPEQEKKLQAHLAACPHCQKKKAEYQLILSDLKKKPVAEPNPYFWERLQPKLQPRRKLDSFILWKQWGLRTVPLSLMLVIILALGIIFLLPSNQEELSQSETLLLRNVNPFQETQTLFEQEKPEEKNMMLIFTSLDENSRLWRPFP